MVSPSQLLDIPRKVSGAIGAVIIHLSVGRRMKRPGIRDLVGRAMIDKEFIVALVRDPHTLLADYELSAEERAAIMQAVGRTTSTSEQERTRALQVVLMKRWAT
jgi:hypothetical protein